MTERPVIGIVGLGNMGASIAARLAETHHVVGYDIRPSPAAQALAADGRLTLASSPDGVAQGSTVVLSLPTPTVSHDTIATLAPVLREGMIIETSTVSPADMQAGAALCEPSATRIVDAAILAGVQPMLDGAATLLVGGAPDDVEAARPTLESFSAQVHVLGPLGAGMAAKVINNAVAHAVMVVLAEAGALAASCAVPGERLAELLAGPDGGLIRPLEHRFRERILRGDFAGGMPTQAARKDSALALALAQDGGVPLFGIQGCHTVYELAVSAGLGQLDYASIATLWETWTGRVLQDGA